MSELTESLASALMEQRDTLNSALAAMHRTHVLLLQMLSLERMGTTHPLDPNTMNSDQLNTLAERLIEHSSLKYTIESTVEEHVSDKVSYALENDVNDKIHDAMSGYIDNLEIEVECSASIRNGN